VNNTNSRSNQVEKPGIKSGQIYGILENASRLSCGRRGLSFVNLLRGCWEQSPFQRWDSRPWNASGLGWHFVACLFFCSALNVPNQCYGEESY